MPHWGIEVVNANLFIYGVPLAMIVGYIAGRAHSYLLQRFVYAAPKPPIPRVHHITPKESFSYTPLYPQDAPTSVFPILAAMPDTTEIPITDFDKLVSTTPYRKADR